MATTPTNLAVVININLANANTKVCFQALCLPLSPLLSPLLSAPSFNLQSLIYSIQIGRGVAEVTRCIYYQYQPMWS